ncbi:binary toxin-like calcium binding domain-containing protein [Spiroplasma melliferum]|uniref:binary toxin-like calcium binding domain-containing protein n=1 Tax=Spiroplasma melliferum TaxID=2134 RepID=UPI0002A63DD3|nr:binary toxin-like calcium binding domain-containing protein [Spiroplasma melliferum]ELL44126.1 protective antigen [Spiroplasma melliferum IPMB4A]
MKQNLNDFCFDQEQKMNSDEKIFDDDYDSDDDGIPDSWEINGYTVEHGKIVKWDEKKHGKGNFVKYKSDPYNSHTTGDPYSDADKVLGNVDEAILPEARHPLVAAYPKIGVNMERLILSKNQTITSEKGSSKGEQTTKTVSASTSNSHMESNRVGGEVSVKYPLGVSVTANYSHEWSNTVTVDNTKSDTTGESKTESWTEALGMNTVDAALLNGNVKYLNVGTAPIYNVRPTLNFILGNNNLDPTLHTIIAKSNTTANVIFPGESYPEKNQNPISWNTSDDFNANPIKVTYEQVETIQKGKGIEIQTIQTSGLYKIYNSEKFSIINEYQRWEYIMGDIYSRTAAITLVFHSGIISERRVYAPKVTDKNPPHHLALTLQEAIELAFPGVVIKDEKLFHKDIKYGYVNIITDKKTHDLMHQQMAETNNKSIYQVKLKQGMNILFKEDETLYVQNELNNIYEELRALHFHLPLIEKFHFNKKISSLTIAEFKQHLIDNNFDEKIVKNIKFHLTHLGFWTFVTMEYENLRPWPVSFSKNYLHKY